MTWALSLWAGLAVLGFAMVFSVPRGRFQASSHWRSWPTWCAAWAWTSAPRFRWPASVLLCWWGSPRRVIAPRTDQATPIYAFAPVIPLIPGTYMFNALTGMLELTSGKEPNPSAIVDAAVMNGSIATLTVIALAVGAITPTLLVGRHLARLVSSGPSEGE